MKKLVATIITLCSLLACNRLQDHGVVAVTNPCDTFCAEYAPNRNPRLEKINGKLVLFLSFTPAPSEEADRIRNAAKKGVTVLKLNKTEKLFTAENYTKKHELVIPIKSVDEAKILLSDLCFKESDLYIPKPLQ